MVHVNMSSLNLGTCSVICAWIWLTSGISSILKQNNANLQTFIDKSLDDVLPKFRQRVKYLQDFYLTFSRFCTKYQNYTKENGTVQKCVNFSLCMKFYLAAVETTAARWVAWERGYRKAYVTWPERFCLLSILWSLLLQYPYSVLPIKVRNKNAGSVRLSIESYRTIFVLSHKRGRA